VALATEKREAFPERLKETSGYNSVKREKRPEKGSSDLFYYSGMKAVARKGGKSAEAKGRPVFSQTKKGRRYFKIEKKEC